VTDTQWSRFEVFQQNRPDGLHQNIGSVHAPDAEMALMNARDVFVRRPTCFSLWVIPEDAIFSMTDQELRENPLQRITIDEEDPAFENYFVFQKSSQRRSMVYVAYSGQVEASSPAQALARALEKYSDAETFVWWVCPESAIIESLESDAEIMFDPAESKTYRHPREYKVVSAMQDVKKDRRSNRDK
jgi:ring-1,2-phenylacetyl-CoA epoxidase subunit PaaB